MGLTLPAKSNASGSSSLLLLLVLLSAPASFNSLLNFQFPENWRRVWPRCSSGDSSIQQPSTRSVSIYHRYIKLSSWPHRAPQTSYYIHPAKVIQLKLRKKFRPVTRATRNFRPAAGHPRTPLPQQARRPGLGRSWRLQVRRCRVRAPPAGIGCPLRPHAVRTRCRWQLGDTSYYGWFHWFDASVCWARAAGACRGGGAWGLGGLWRAAIPPPRAAARPSCPCVRAFASVRLSFSAARKKERSRERREKEEKGREDERVD